jgi:hypothetical protein
MARVAGEVWGKSSGQYRPPDGLAFDDDVLRAVLIRLHRAALAEVTDLYAAPAAEFIAVHLLTNHGNAPAPAGARRRPDHPPLICCAPSWTSTTSVARRRAARG